MSNRDIITSVGKGTSLTQAEHDQNHKSFAGTVEEQTGTTYEVVYTDQNKTIELNNASMVCTLDAIADLHTAIDTDNFKVTLKNTNATAATVQRSSTDTIDGETSITLVENEVITLQTDTTGGEWTIKSTGIVSSNTTLTSPVFNTGVSGTAIETTITDTDTKFPTSGAVVDYVAGLQTIEKVLTFSGWNMDTTTTKTVAHGLTLSKIRCVSVLIKYGSNYVYDFASYNGSSTTGIFADATNVNIQRDVGGFFDDPSFFSVDGYVIVKYVA